MNELLIFPSVSDLQNSLFEESHDPTDSDFLFVQEDTEQEDKNVNDSSSSSGSSGSFVDETGAVSSGEATATNGNNTSHSETEEFTPV